MNPCWIYKNCSIVETALSTLTAETYGGCSSTIEILLVIHTILDEKLSKYDVLIYQHLFMKHIEEISTHGEELRPC